MRHLRMPSLRSYWVTVILWSPSRPLMGEVASFAPFHICYMQIHGSDAASEDAFASLLLGDGDIMEPLPSTCGGSGILCAFPYLLNANTRLGCGI